MTTKEHCSECGAEVEYHWISAATYDDPNGREYVPWRCPDRSCINHDPRNHTYGWSN